MLPFASFIFFSKPVRALTSVLASIACESAIELPCYRCSHILARRERDSPEEVVCACLVRRRSPAGTMIDRISSSCLPPSPPAAQHDKARLTRCDCVCRRDGVTAALSSPLLVVSMMMTIAARSLWMRATSLWNVEESDLHSASSLWAYFPSSLWMPVAEMPVWSFGDGLIVMTWSAITVVW